MELILSKNGFNIEEINAVFKSFCSANVFSNDELLKLELINEEFLTNILFPNFNEEVKLSVHKEDNGLILSYEYQGVDYMNKITEITIVSLKILQNKTKDIIVNTSDGKTTVKFVV